MVYLGQYISSFRWEKALLLCFLSLILLRCDSGNSDTTPPEPPSGLSATSQDGAVLLEWNAVQAEDLAGYNVYRSTSSGVNTSGDPLESEVSSAEYVDETAENGTTYYYGVTAIDKAENESGSSGEVEKTPFATPPDRP